MAKRTPLTEMHRRVSGAAEEEKPAGKYITTAVHLPKATHDLLKRVANERSIKQGGRTSVSKLLAEIVEAQRSTLEAEI